MLFDQDELEAWLRQGRMGGEVDTSNAKTITSESATVEAEAVVEIPAKHVYHRCGLYR